jgi:hypothetical protein
LKAYTYIVAVLVVVVLISYTSGYTALNAYKSWIDYSNPYAGALEHVRYEDVGVFQPLADNLVFILLDGVTVDVLLDLRKSISDVDRLLSMGALYANGLSITPSYSVPARASILTGAPPEIHGVSSNEYTGSLRVDSIVRAAWERGYTILCSGDGSFKRLFREYIRECVDIEEGASHGAISLAAGLDLLRRYSSTSKVFLWMGIADVDMVGHKVGGPAEVEYNATIINIIRLTLELVETLKREGFLNKTLLVILNDHGFKRGGHHGGLEPEVRRVFTLFIGPHVKPGFYETPFTQYDVTPTISMLMGWRIPIVSIGRPLTEGFNIDSNRVTAYVETSRTQGYNLVKAVAEMAGVEVREVADPLEAYSILVESKLREGMYVRLVLALAIVTSTLLVALLLLRTARHSIGKADIVVVVLSIIAFEASYWLAYTAIRGPWSLSDIYSFDEVVSKIRASTAVGGLALGLTIGVAEITPYRSGFRRALVRALTAIAIVMVIGLLYSLPTIITYGLTVRFPFPDWGNAVLYFTSLMRVAFTGFTVLPIALATSITLTVIGAYLFRRLKMG